MIEWLQNQSMYCKLKAQLFLRARSKRGAVETKSSQVRAALPQL